MWACLESLRLEFYLCLNDSSSVFCRMFPEHHAYTTPIYFSSDWLNEYWDTLDVDDYRFVYMGPKGSW